MPCALHAPLLQAWGEGRGVEFKLELGNGLSWNGQESRMRPPLFFTNLDAHQYRGLVDENIPANLGCYV